MYPLSEVKAEFPELETSCEHFADKVYSSCLRRAVVTINGVKLCVVHIEERLQKYGHQVWAKLQEFIDSLEGSPPHIHTHYSDDSVAPIPGLREVCQEGFCPPRFQR